MKIQLPRSKLRWILPFYLKSMTHKNNDEIMKNSNHIQFHLSRIYNQFKIEDKQINNTRNEFNKFKFNKSNFIGCTKYISIVENIQYVTKKPAFTYW